MTHLPHQHRRAGDEAVDPPPGLTYEQLEFFTHQTERAVSKAHKMALEADKKRARQRMVGFVLLFVAFLANLLYSNQLSDEARHAIVRSGNAISVSGCNRDYEDRVAIRTVLIESKGFTRQAVKAGRLDPAEGQLRLDFYNERLADLPLPDCRKSEDVITDDPDTAGGSPEPKYPRPRDTENIVPPVSANGGDSSRGSGSEEGQP